MIGAASVRTAIRALWLHRLRSLLTMAGIAIGIAAVMLMIAIGSATQRQVISQIQNLGANLLVVAPGERTARSGGVRLSNDGATTLTEADADAIERELASVQAVGALWWGGAQAVIGNRNSWSRIHGITPGFLETRAWAVQDGRPITADDHAAMAKVAVLGQTIVDRLFEPWEDPVGQVIRLRNVPFQVVGVLTPKGQSFQGQDQDEIIYVPLSTARVRLNTQPLPEVRPVSAIAGSRRFANPGERSGGGFQKVERRIANPSVVNAGAVKSIMIRTHDVAGLAVAKEEVRSLLRQRHRLGPGDPDDFQIRNLSEVAEARAASARLLTGLLIGISALSLLIAGIGIMNIMLVSVTERTAEIGLRMAVGATRRDILAQFLTEAGVLALVSGLIGVAVGIGGILAVGAWTDTAPEIDPLVALVAFAAAGGIGVVFGLYPAWQASKLDPIVALRRV